MNKLISLAIVVFTAAVAPSVFAHTGEGIDTGFASGFWHPILGWDHVAAMVAVGMWGAFLGTPAIWILPVVFPIIMAFGAAAGMAGLPLPAVEMGIALSGVVLGLMVLFAVRPPLVIAAILVGLFAIFHGHAHGTEFPPEFSALGYAVGFVLATGLMHLAGIAIGWLTKFKAGTWIVRAGGAVVTLAGSAFLFGFA